MALRCLQIETSSRTTDLNTKMWEPFTLRFGVQRSLKTISTKLRGPIAFAFYFQDGIIVTRYSNLTSDRNQSINPSWTQATMPSTIPKTRAWTKGELGDSRNSNENQEGGTSVFHISKWVLTLQTFQTKVLGFRCLSRQRKHLAYDSKNKKHPYKLKSSNCVIHCLPVLPNTLKDGMGFPSVQTDTRITAPPVFTYQNEYTPQILALCVWVKEGIVTGNLHLLGKNLCRTQTRYYHISHKSMQYYGRVN